MKLQSITDYDYKWGPLIIKNKRVDFASDKLSKWIVNLSIIKISNSKQEKLVSFCSTH